MRWEMIPVFRGILFGAVAVDIAGNRQPAESFPDPGEAPPARA
jgi:hypothetical protein